MKEVGFIAIAGLVSAILTRFLPEVPSHENAISLAISLAGTLAAIAGGAIGILFRKLDMWPLVLIILVSLGLAVFSLNRFNWVVAGEPGPEAANLLYLWTALLFLPAGVLIEVAGLKITKSMPVRRTGDSAADADDGA